METWGNPTYCSDYTALWFRNLDFLQEERFRRAYTRGIDSGHRLGNGGDIHIEYRIAMCCWAAWHAKHLPGDFVECGVHTGIMSLAICDYLDFNSLDKSFWLFDTYDGIPDDQISEAEREHAERQNKKFSGCYDIARRNFAPFPRARLVKGAVPDTLASAPVERLCYLMLDMNVAPPEKAALEFFWPKIVPGGIVLFDDYGWHGYDASKHAHDAFAEKQGLKIFNLPTGQGMLLKPPFG